MISREHTLTIDAATADRLEQYSDDPERMLDELLDTTLVVRVVDAGDYTIDYTDETGAARTQTLTGLTPGSPASVANADPLAPAVLKRGEEVIAVRGGVNAVWWHAGDLPLGLNMTPGAKAVYDFRGRLDESLTLDELDLREQQGILIDSLSFRLALPMEGTASWQLDQDAGDGAPLLLAGEARIPSGAGDLAVLEVVATQNGAPGTAGVVAGVNEASARGSAKLWIKDGEPAAAQFLGGGATADPRVTMWADGFFADLAQGQSCAGKSRADACEPEEIEPFSHTADPSDKEVFAAADMPRAEDDAGREALALLQRLFAQDIVPGDSAKLIARGDAEDFSGGDPNAPQGNFLFEFTLDAVAVEDVTVPAGTFSALKILEETRTVLNVQQFRDPSGTTLVQPFGIDETIARVTMWIDAKTYEPVKMVAETPIDVDAVLKRMMESVDASAWDQIGGKPLSERDWRVSASASSSYELREHRPGTQFSALVGLGLAHSLAGSFAGGPYSMAMAGIAPASMVTGGSPEPIYYEERPHEIPVEAISLSLTSEGAIVDGVARFTIASASEGLTWDRLALATDTGSLYLDGNPECGAPTDYTFAACRGAEGLGYEASVLAGDTIAILAQPGQTLQVIDNYTGAVVVEITIG